MMKKRENDTREPLYRRLKTRGILPCPNLEEKYGPLDQTPPLDARSITPPKVLNDVLRVSKRQKQ